MQSQKVAPTNQGAEAKIISAAKQLKNKNPVNVLPAADPIF